MACRRWPVYSSNPTIYSGIDAAELIFGVPSANQVYATSTQLNFVDHLAFYDGWGNTAHLYSNPLAEDYFSDLPPAGYLYPIGGPAFSAYVKDHSGYSASAMGGLNYAFIRTADVANNVPEAGSMAMMLGAALGGLGLLNWRRGGRAGQ